MPLEQGLRQGCVLSPILYCAFINAFLADKPDTPTPAPFEWVVRWAYSQGLQNEEGEGTGVHSVPLAKTVKAMLFMDDVTLLAKTKAGLTRMVARYLEFCRVFRIRLNPGKSKLMHFTHGQPDVSPIRVGDVTVEHPAGGVHNHLGYAMDSAFTGGPQLDRMAGVVAGKRLVVAAIARVMGEDVAAWYVRTTLEPSALYGIELIPKWLTAQHGKVQRAFHQMAVETMRCGALNDWWQGEIRAKHGCLHREAGLKRWTLQVDRRMMGLLRGLAVAEGSLAARMFKAKTGQCVQSGATGMGFVSMAPQRKGAFLSKACKVAEQMWGTSPLSWPVWEPGKFGKRALKESLDWVLGERQSAMDVVDAVPRPPNAMGQQSNMVYLKAMCAGGWMGGGLGPSLTQQWRQAVPSNTHRIFLRRMMMGAIPHLRVNVAKMGSGMRGWSAEAKADWVQCPCGKGIQDAEHFFHACGKTQGIRDAVDVGLCKLVEGKVPDHHAAIWAGLCPRARMEHALSWKGVFATGI